jgi:TolB protein
VHAQLNIEIFGGGASRIPVAIVPFADENKLQQSITPVISADLQRTGLFRLIDPAGLSPHAPCGSRVFRLGSTVAPMHW